MTLWGLCLPWSSWLPLGCHNSFRVIKSLLIISSKHNLWEDAPDIWLSQPISMQDRKGPLWPWHWSAPCTRCFRLAHDCTVCNVTSYTAHHLIWFCLRLPRSARNQHLSCLSKLLKGPYGLSSELNLALLNIGSSLLCSATIHTLEPLPLLSKHTYPVIRIRQPMPNSECHTSICVNLYLSAHIVHISN